jgi:hypothetical protein
MGRLLRGLPILLLAGLLANGAGAVKKIAWEDTPAPIRTRLHTRGITSATFGSYVERLHREHERRVREGDLDHLVFYLLQSTHFTNSPPIEPALSAKDLVDGLAAVERQAFLRDGKIGHARVPPGVQSRISALVTALESSDPDPRLEYFRRLAAASFPERATRDQALMREYLRSMRFLYEKEFVAQRSAQPAEAVEELYHSRGLSTDTAVEAGYLVYLGLGVVKSLEPERRIRRVLIVGPGLDLAPRTGLLEAGPPESYQPWTVIDALLALGLARADDLQVVAADINPRVVEHLRLTHATAPVLRLVSGIGESESVVLSEEYREYFARLGTAVGKVDAKTVSVPAHLSKVVSVAPAAARTLDAETLDIVTERLDPGQFDLAIATNILPYFDDVELALAVGNISSMLATGGVLLHNEMRPAMREVATAAGLRFEQSRQAIIATVHGAPAPLGDSIWIHRKDDP